LWKRTPHDLFADVGLIEGLVPNATKEISDRSRGAGRS
jgi:hypothetical protein